MKFKKADLRLWRVKDSGEVLVFWYGQPELAEYANRNPGKLLGTPFYVRGTPGGPMADSTLSWNYWKDSLIDTGNFFDPKNLS